MDSAVYKDAVVHYTTALTLDPLSTYFLAKRSEARAAIGSWQDSLQDADAVRISLFRLEQRINVIPGDQTRPVISTWLRKKACSTTWRSPLR